MRVTRSLSSASQLSLTVDCCSAEHMNDGAEYLGGSSVAWCGGRGAMS